MRIPPDIPILINVWCLVRLKNNCVHFAAETSQVPHSVVSLNVADAVEWHYSRRRRRVIRLHRKVLLTLVSFLRITFSPEVWLQDTRVPFFLPYMYFTNIKKYSVKIAQPRDHFERDPCHSQTTEFFPRSVTDMDMNYTRDNVNYITRGKVINCTSVCAELLLVYGTISLQVSFPPLVSWRQTGVSNFTSRPPERRIDLDLVWACDGGGARTGTMTGTSAIGGEEVNCSTADVVAAVTTVATAAGVVVVMTAWE